jgi:hypothetical protein
MTIDIAALRSLRDHLAAHRTDRRRLQRVQCPRAGQAAHLTPITDRLVQPPL